MLPERGIKYALYASREENYKFNMPFMLLREENYRRLSRACIGPVNSMTTSKP